MKKLSYLLVILVVSSFFIRCNETEVPLPSDENLKNSEEQSLLKSAQNPNICSDNAEAAWLLASDYRKTVNDLRHQGKNTNSDDLAAAIDEASATFEELQDAHYQMMNECSQPPPEFDPDEYESNNTIQQAYHLGEINPVEQISWQANFHNPSIDQHDWYRIIAVDGPLGEPLKIEEFNIQLNLTMSGERDYDLYLYNSSGTLLDNSNNSGNIMESIQYAYTGTYGTDDSRIFYIEVRYYSGDATDVPYYLIISFSETI